MRHFHHLVAPALLLAGAASADPLPESPHHLRSAAPITEVAPGAFEFDHAHLPPLRTTRDGRVGLDMKLVGGKIALSVIAPEKLADRFDPADHSLSIIDRRAAGEIDPAAYFNGTVRHTTLCDAPNPAHPNGGGGANPRPCGKHDCYDLTLVSSVEAGGGVQLVGTPVTVKVARPKTANARVARVKVYAWAQVETSVLPIPELLEPMITADGKLLVGRLSNDPLDWTDAAGSNRSGTYEIVYGQSQNPCDVAGYTDLKPISHAPYDPAMQAAGYGIADRPFRDSEGREVPNGEELRGTYPWIDRQGHTLFFTGVRSTLHYAVHQKGQPLEDWPIAQRFSATCLDQTCPSIDSWDDIELVEAASATRGLTMVGRWTRGKMVLLDNSINHTDFGFGNPDVEQREVTLYQDAQGLPQAIRVGGARDNGADVMPPNSVTNSTFIDSFENRFNADPNMQPVTPRDVVWRINTGHGTAEVAFDDYLDPRGFIVSEMAAALTFDDGKKALNHHDGFEYRNTPGASKGPIAEPRVQNAATADDLVLPAHGKLLGGARIEPVALGGIEGKGVWLDGVDDALSYPIPAQNGLGAKTWYVGLFIDARVDAGEVRRLLTMPDGSWMELVGRDRIVVRDAAGNERTQVPLAPSWRDADTGWTHVAFVNRDDGRDLEFYIDGVLTTISTGVDQALRMESGVLTVGAVGGDAFRGWIDELKVFAYAPNPEVMCNHARGTLAAVDAHDLGVWEADNTSADAASHVRISALLTANGYDAAPAYICYHDYTADRPVGVADLPVEATSVRQALLFPEGPLVGAQARPDSSQNTFCTSCHVEGAHQPDSLLPAALDPDTVAMFLDPRRQPMQPPARIFGQIPATLAPFGMDMTAPLDGLSVDLRLHPADPSDAGTVEEHTHTEGGTGDPLISLDLYIPEGAVAAPLVVYVHGGWFIGGQKEAIGEKARLFNEAGYAFATVDYRLAPNAPWPAQAEDVSHALVWLRGFAENHDGIDPDRIGLLGHSAGAHIAADVSTNPDHLDGAGASLDLVRCTAANDFFAYDLVDYLDWACDRNKSPEKCDRFETLFGSANLGDAQVREDASPFHQLQAGAGIGPFMVIFDTIDATHQWVARAQSQGFVRALNAVGVPATGLAATGMQHEQVNDDLGTDGDPITPELLAFFDSCL